MVIRRSRSPTPPPRAFFGRGPVAVSLPPSGPVLTPPPATPRPTPRVRAAALGHATSPPREVGPALPGRRVAPGKILSKFFSHGRRHRALLSTGATSLPRGPSFNPDKSGGEVLIARWRVPQGEVLRLSASSPHLRDGLSYGATPQK